MLQREEGLAKEGRGMQLKEGIGMEKKGRKNRTYKGSRDVKGHEWSLGMKEGWVGGGGG